MMKKMIFSLCLLSFSVAICYAFTLPDKLTCNTTTKTCKFPQNKIGLHVVNFPPFSYKGKVTFTNIGETAYAKSFKFNHYVVNNKVVTAWYTFDGQGQNLVIQSSPNSIVVADSTVIHPTSGWFEYKLTGLMKCIYPNSPGSCLLVQQ